MIIYENVEFKYKFRDYQQRVLDTMDKKIGDKRLHIVAAPGSGKTVLGLEIIRRLNEPVTIFVPSLSLQNQWKDRFLTLFVGENEKSVWDKKISFDLSNPGVITIATYQALYSKCCDDTGFVANTHVICLDEAHHLKNEWWKALEQYCLGNEDRVIISLTATPPYDSTDAEWARYNKLCGDIDIEIFVPEMVQKNCLCPHQDYVVLCEPTREELEEARREIDENQQAMTTILNSKSMYENIKNLASLKDIKGKGQVFISEPDYLLALMSYIKNYGIDNAAFYDGAGAEIEWVKLTKGLNENSSMNENMFEVLMRGILDFDEKSYSDEFKNEIKEALVRNHFMKNDRFTIGREQEKIEKIFKNTRAKITAIEEIIESESNALKNQLRCLVLLDHVRKEDLSKIGSAMPITDLGCVSVFEALRRLEHKGNLDRYFNNKKTTVPRVGMLTGSLIILPDWIVRENAELSREVCVTEKEDNTGYSIIEVAKVSAKRTVEIVTELLEKGKIQILVGTAALLGEGWDAPCVNSVIIGSTACTYVQSNQMRGRGLRIDPNNPDKVSNIWHITSYSKENMSEYRRMCKRFDYITCLSYDGASVENGIERIGLKEKGEIDIELHNKKTFDLSANREKVRQMWNDFIYAYKDLSRVRDVVIIPKKKNVFGMTNARPIYSMSEGLLKTLKEIGLISKDVNLCKEVAKGGLVDVYLEKASSRENAIFTECLKQIFGPINKSRYIVRKKKIFGGTEYYAVPDVLGNNKKYVEKFFENSKSFGYSLVNTRTDEGARELLEIRMKQLRITKASARVIRSVVL